MILFSGKTWHFSASYFQHNQIFTTQTECKLLSIHPDSQCNISVGNFFFSWHQTERSGQCTGLHESFLVNIFLTQGPKDYVSRLKLMLMSFSPLCDNVRVVSVGVLPDNMKVVLETLPPLAGPSHTPGCQHGSRDSYYRWESAHLWFGMDGSVCRQGVKNDDETAV